MYDLDMLKRKSRFLCFVALKPPVCCDAIYRLGCLVASSFALIRNVGFAIFVSAFALKSVDEQTFSYGDFE